MLRMLQTVFPGYQTFLFQFLIRKEVKFDTSWFPNRPNHPSGYWNSKRNQRAFLLNLEKKLKITEPKDWGKVSYDKVTSYFTFS